jgi:hypothetical protein
MYKYVQCSPLFCLGIYFTYRYCMSNIYRICNAQTIHYRKSKYPYQPEFAIVCLWLDPRPSFGWYRLLSCFQLMHYIKGVVGGWEGGEGG